MAERDELLKKCEELGLSPEKSRNRVNKETGEKYKESTVKDLRKALQNYYVQKYRAEGTLSPFVLEVMKLDSPMLALQSKDKKLDKIRDYIWEDKNNWIFQEKIDGCRCILCWDKDYGYDFYSRNPSVVDQLPTSYRTKLLVPPLDATYLVNHNINSFMIDTELVPMNKEINDMSDGTHVVADTQLNLVTGILGSLDDLAHKMQETNPLKFIAFDLLMINGEWKNDEIYLSRYKTLLELLSVISLAGLSKKVSIVPSTMTNKHEFYENILSMGGEGCVAKDLNSKYDMKGRRAGEWIKLKRTISQSLLMEKTGDTVDAFITGFKPGNPGTSNENRIGALEFSVYLTDDNNEYIEDENGNPIVHHIATISGIDNALRDMATQYGPSGELQLNPVLYGKVAEIDGQDISSKNMRFAHATFQGWRPDRSAETCKMMKSFLERMIL